MTLHIFNMLLGWTSFIFLKSLKSLYVIVSKRVFQSDYYIIYNVLIYKDIFNLGC